MHHSSDRGAIFPWTAALCCFTIGATVLTTLFRAAYPCTHDDAYIAFQFARRIAEGHGPVFNPGERICGYTSPLQVGLLTIPALVGLPIDRSAVILAVTASCTSGLLVFALFRALNSPPFAVTAALLAVTSGFSFSFPGMETHLLLLLDLSFLYALERGRSQTAGVLAALACLTRPDALLLVGPAIALAPAVRLRRALPPIIITGTLWTAFALWFYGDWLPQTLYAKTHQVASGFLYLSKALTRLSHLAVFSPAAPPTSTAAGHAGFAAAGSVMALAALSLLNPEIRRRRWLLFALLGYPWLHLTAYAIIRPPAGHLWHSLAPASLLGLGAFAGVFTALERLSRRFRAPAVRATGALVSVSLAALVLSFNLSGQLDRIAERERRFWWGPRHRAYLRIAEWLNQHAAPGALVLAREPGTIAFHSDVVVKDNYLISRGPGADPDFLVSGSQAESIQFRGTKFGAATRITERGFRPVTIFRAVGGPSRSVGAK